MLHGLDFAKLEKRQQFMVYGLGFVKHEMRHGFMKEKKIEILKILSLIILKYITNFGKHKYYKEWN